MQLEQYFATTKGTGVFATCDGKRRPPSQSVASSAIGTCQYFAV